MILIAESGSTKCDWVLLDTSGVEHQRWKTIGFNPYFHSEEVIVNTLSKSSEVTNCQDQISQVWFYGAGCSTDDLRGIVKLALNRVFCNSHNNVGHDLEASAYALYQGKPFIAGILGTGSNCCAYDGKSITQATPSLAYILGDEGSASFIGKSLVADFLYGKMPEDLQVEFDKTYGVTKDEVITAVYHKPHANVYLASFGPFAGKWVSHPYIYKLVRKGFEKFIDIHVSAFNNEQIKEVSFVGSVAKSFEGILKECLNEKGYNLGQILAKPIDSLVMYHVNHMGILN